MVSGNTSDITREMVFTPVAQSKFDFTADKMIKTEKKRKCETKRAKETNNINEQELE